MGSVMSERAVETDRSGVPVRVYHHHSREVWTHDYLDACELCAQTGATLKQRGRTLTALRQAAVRTVAPSGAAVAPSAAIVAPSAAAPPWPVATGARPLRGSVLLGNGSPGERTS